LKNNIKTLAIVFSVVLNIAFLTFTAYSRWSHAPVARSPSGEGVMLYEQLDLTAEQLKRIEPLRDRFHAEMNRIGEDIRVMQMELFDLLAAPAPDRQAIQAHQEKIRDLQRSMQDNVVNHVLEESTVLTPEQRVKFFQLLKERSKTAGRSCPPWMKPPKGAEANEKHG